MALGACGLNVEGTLNTNNADDAGSDGGDTTGNADNPGTPDTGGEDVDTGPVMNPNYKNRVTDGLVALYDFEEGAETTVSDGIKPSLNLTIPQDDLNSDPIKVQWLDHALSINDFTLIQSSGPASKTATAKDCNAMALSVEAWVKPSDGSQGDGRIVTMYGVNSSGTPTQRFTFSSNVSTSSFGASFRGENLTVSESVPTGLVHLVATRESGGARSFYVNGGLMNSQSTSSRTSSNWWNNYYLRIGSTSDDGDQAWTGEIHLVAIYCRALDADEVLNNCKAGPDPVPVDGTPQLRPGPVIAASSEEREAASVPQSCPAEQSRTYRQDGVRSWHANSLARSNYGRCSIGDGSRRLRSQRRGNVEHQ
ncbi:MAG: LamG domain-containing protein [Polyangiaceae bacterium]|nr:LamG domain-containing protein [Polyangiaceae bacterium]